MGDRLGLTDLPAEAQAHACFLAEIGASGGGATKVAVTLVGMILQWVGGATAALEMGRRYSSVRALPIGTPGVLRLAERAALLNPAVWLWSQDRSSVVVQRSPSLVCR